MTDLVAVVGNSGRLRDTVTYVLREAREAAQYEPVPVRFLVPVEPTEWVRLLRSLGRRVDTLRETLRLPEADPPDVVETRLDPSALRALRAECRGHAEALWAERPVEPLLERWEADAQQWFTPGERRLAGGYETVRTLADVADVAIDAGVALRVRG